jgi:hypothetical protein
MEFWRNVGSFSFPSHFSSNSRSQLSSYFVGKFFLDFIFEGGHEAAEAEIVESLTGKARPPLLLKFRSKFGTYSNFSMSTHPLFDDAGTIVGSIFIGSNSSARDIDIFLDWAAVDRYFKFNFSC